jgi:hypothetical protein
MQIGWGIMPEPERRWAFRYTIIVMIVLFPLIPLAEHFVGPGSGRPAVLSAGLMVVVVWWRWDLRAQRWFWAIVAAFIMLHIALITSTHWTTKWVPAAMSIPLGFADGLLILKTFSLGERFFGSG